MHRHSCRVGRSPLLLAAALGVIAAACSPYDVTTHSELDRLERTTYPTLVMAPPQLFMEHHAFQAYQYAADLAALLTLEGRIPVMTSWEQDAEREQHADVPSEVVMGLLDAAGLSVHDIVMLEVRVDEAMTARTVQAPLQMGGGLEHHYESDVTVTLTLRDFGRRNRLAQVMVAFEDPPFSEDATAANPRPVLREGIREAGRKLIGLFEDRFSTPPDGAVPDLELLYNPRDLFIYREPDSTPLETEFESLDELDRLASRLVYYQYFEPDISGRTMRQFEESEPGILVEALGDDAGGLGLREGDYIVAVDGQRVGGVHTLARSFLLTEVGAEVALRVERDGLAQTIRVPVVEFSD